MAVHSLHGGGPVQLNQGARCPNGLPLKWEELTSPTLGRLLNSEAFTVGLLPVGATEQHGPHLPAGTDTIIAQALCDTLSTHGGCISMPALPIGASWWHGKSLAGTIGTSGEEVSRLAVTVARGAADSGLRRLLFVNGHVGNVAALSMACDRLRVELPDMLVGVLSWWEVDAQVTEEVCSDALDWHANRAETSLMLALRPELVDIAAAKGADDPDRTAGMIFRYRCSQVSTNGVTGKPSEADAEMGQRLWNNITAAGAEIVARANKEKPPL